ncbi:MAG: hypothetical protein J5802_06985 [Butyrivibrio sp.]|nr:hypothetical protein [Butyrivibrio sp.]
MIKKSIFLSVAAMLIMTGCANNGGNIEPETTEQADNSDVNEAGASESIPETLPSTWEDITEEEANEDTVRLFKIPEGAENVQWSMKGTGDSEYPLIQAKFVLDGVEYTARTQYGASENSDISELDNEWATTETGNIGWYDGNMEARFCSYVGDESINLCTCYDFEIGIAYSFEAKAKDLEGFDITSVVNLMEPEMEHMLSSFVEQAAGKDSFSSYDEVISYLTKGQGYTYIKLTGSESDLLIVTEKTYKSGDKNVSTDAYIFVNNNGKIMSSSSLYTTDEKYPLTVRDGILYECKPNEYATWVVGPDGDGIMMKDCITKYPDTGSYVGFTRESNDFESTVDFTGGEKEYKAYWENYNTEDAIDFTVVE